MIGMKKDKPGGGGFAIMFGGPKASKGPSMGGDDDEPDGDEGGGMDGARKQAAQAVAKALGAQGVDVDSLDSALQAFVEACQSGGYEK